MAVPAFTLRTSDQNTAADNVSETALFTVGSSESVVFCLGTDGAATGTPTIDSNAADVSITQNSQFGNQTSWIGIWKNPGSGSKTVAGLQSFTVKGWAVLTTSSVDQTTPADGSTSSNCDGCASNTFSIPTQTGHRAVSVTVSNGQPVGAATEIHEVQLDTGTGAWFTVQEGTDSSSVDMSATGLSDQSSWAGFNVREAGGGGGSGVTATPSAGVPLHQHVHHPTRRVTVFMRDRLLPAAA